MALELTSEERLAHDLAEKGWSVSPSFLDWESVSLWSRECHELFRSGAFRPAGVGRAASLRVQPEVRNDHVLWLDPAALRPFERSYLERMNGVRESLNRELYLGLLGFEAHLSVFSAGARYRSHLDQFQGSSDRIVSATLYLNENWRSSDGGGLRLYLSEPESEPYEDILPIGGTLVLFLSARFHHEVLPSRRDRMSITGWFTRRKLES